MRRRIHYELEADDVEGFGGSVVIERWSTEGDLRILIIEKNIITSLTGEKRANLVLSPAEARRIAKQLVVMSGRG